MKTGSTWVMALFIVGQLSAGESVISSQAKQEPPKVGNFALPGSQQPGQFLSFGANILDKDEVQFQFATTFLHGISQYQTTMTPAYIYGYSDKTSMLLQLPVAVRYGSAGQHSSSLSDALLQFESSFYDFKNSYYEDQATMVTGIYLPTGNSGKMPATGTGSVGLFVGTTFTRTCIDWLYFTSVGMLWNTRNDEIKYGNQLFYQFGLGKNIFNIRSEWILAWILEMDGQFTERNQGQALKDSNTGGNVILLTPSFFVSSKSLIFQIGAGFPMVQTLNGTQAKNNYVLAAQLSFSFYQ